MNLGKEYTFLGLGQNGEAVRPRKQIDVFMVTRPILFKQTDPSSFYEVQNNIFQMPAIPFTFIK